MVKYFIWYMNISKIQVGFEIEAYISILAGAIAQIGKIEVSA